MEELPYRAPWERGFSEDGAWLLTDERSIVGGYESHAIPIRRVGEVDGKWWPLTSAVDAALWTRDGKEMAFSSGEKVMWQSFPDAEPSGRPHKHGIRHAVAKPSGARRKRCVAGRPRVPRV